MEMTKGINQTVSGDPGAVQGGITSSSVGNADTSSQHGRMFAFRNISPFLIIYIMHSDLGDAKSATGTERMKFGNPIGQPGASRNRRGGR